MNDEGSFDKRISSTFRDAVRVGEHLNSARAAVHSLGTAETPLLFRIYTAEIKRELRRAIKEIESIEFSVEWKDSR